MRALLAHPVLRVGIVLLAAASLSCHASAQVPLSIGPLSDYGNVLDRHGRERITALIEETEARLGVSIFILATWENPYSSTRELATAVFHVWNLESGRTLLAVFARTEGQWRLSIVASTLVRQSIRSIETDLESALIDLVEHARVEEAMVELFAQLDRHATGMGRPTQAASEGHAVGIPKPVLVLLVLGLLGGLILLARHRVCPRCGRVLRLDRRPLGGSRSSDRIYFCRHCHYRRGRP